MIFYLENFFRSTCWGTVYKLIGLQYRESRHNSSLTAAETSSFLQPSVKLIMNVLPLQFIQNVSYGVFHHTIDVMN